MWSPRIKLKILESLGEGDQGSVFKALRTDQTGRLQQHVAVKILHSKTAVDLWRKEFESLSRVRSPYCVQVLSFERLKGRPALILEFVDGLSLARLAEFQVLSADLIEEIVAQIQQGLCDLRAAGIFHGDLSPKNVLVDSTGVIRLLDFGFANYQGTTRGTPEFVSPEKLNGGGENFAGDLFALGRIEQYLKRADLAHCPPNNYLHFDPTLRSIRRLKSNLSRREQLAENVRKIQSHDACLSALQTRRWTSNSIHPSRIWICVLTLFFTTMASSASRTVSERTRNGLLILRTNLWHHFALNGRTLGYAPLEIELPSEQSHILDWVSPLGKGRRRVSLKSGEVQKLDDRDFSH